MFHKFKEEFQRNFTILLAFSERRLYRTAITGETLWLTYLSSFPPALQQEYNCNACKQFIRHYGGLVGITERGRKTIWDIDATDEFALVVDKMNTLVLNAPVVDLFITDIDKLGVDMNHERKADGTIITWEHLFMKLPKEMKTDCRVKSIETFMGEIRDNRNVFKRGLDEITVDALETVVELIASNSLYRGSEYQAVLRTFTSLKQQYDKVPVKQRDDWAWMKAGRYTGAVAGIKNTAIGTLLVDISKGEELDIAVRSFERIMAPTNYKRPNAIITNKMIEQAEKTITDLGYGSSLGRRFATVDDIAVTNTIFVDRTIVKKKGGILGTLKEQVIVNPKTLSRVEEIAVEKFVQLQGITRVEVLFENRHQANLVSLIAPVDPKAPSMFKWPNAFSWSYKNALTDSIKEKVKAAGGRTDGELRVSLEWYNFDDLDLHIIEPNDHEICYRDKQSVTGGNLDVDANGGAPSTRTPVENIIWPFTSKMKEGNYKVYVNQFSRRETIDMGFALQIECQGHVHDVEFSGQVMGRLFVSEFSYTRKNGVQLIRGMEVNTKLNSKTYWGVDTNKFHTVSMILPSPNYWKNGGLVSGPGVGNEHLFFIIDQAHNDEQARGFFNEFLSPELEKHKRIFEALGSRMKVEPADKQVSGLGFSSTQHDDLIVRVTGATERILKIKF